MLPTVTPGTCWIVPLIRLCHFPAYAGGMENWRAPQQQIVKRSTVHTGQQTCLSPESVVGPDRCIDAKLASMVPPWFPTHDASTQWSPAGKPVRKSSPNGQTQDVNLLRGTHAGKQGATACYTSDPHCGSKPHTALEDARGFSQSSSCCVPAALHHAETAPLPRKHTPSPTRTLCRFRRPNQEKPKPVCLQEPGEPPRPRSPSLTQKPQPRMTERPESSKGAGSSQQPFGDDQKSAIGSVWQGPDQTVQVEVPAAPTVHASSSHVQLRSRSRSKWLSSCPKESTQFTRSPDSRVRWRPHSAHSHLPRSIDPILPCSFISFSGSSAHGVMGQVSPPPAQSPMHTYAAAKRFGPGRRHSSAPCCLDRHLPQTQQLRSADIKYPQSFSPKLKQTGCQSLGFSARSTSASPMPGWTPASHVSYSPTPMHLHDVIKTSSDAPRAGIFNTRSPHGTGVSRGLTAVVPCTHSSDDSSCGSPVSRAATIWGCSALERALRQVENTLGRTSKKVSLAAPCIQSVDHGRSPHQPFGDKLRRSSTVMQTGHPHHHAPSTLKRLNNHNPKRYQWYERCQSPAAQKLAKKLAHIDLCPIGVPQEAQCMHVDQSHVARPGGDYDESGRVGSWADEPGVYNLEAAALRQAAQKFFRKQR